jgi:hypothetical protein
MSRRRRNQQLPIGSVCLLALLIESQGTTEHNEYTEARHNGGSIRLLMNGAYCLSMVGLISLPSRSHPLPNGGGGARTVPRLRTHG